MKKLKNNNRILRFLYLNDLLTKQIQQNLENVGHKSPFPKIENEGIFDFDQPVSPLFRYLMISLSTFLTFCISGARFKRFRLLDLIETFKNALDAKFKIEPLHPLNARISSFIIFVNQAKPYSMHIEIYQLFQLKNQ